MILTAALLALCLCGTAAAEGTVYRIGICQLVQHVALDPRTAAKVLELSEKIIRENHLMTLMVTHNMKDAIRYGNRLIMMNEGEIILDVRGEEKAKLTKRDLMDKFTQLSGVQMENDAMLLSK